MSDSWESSNNQYLATSLEWLRARVHKLVADVPAAPAPLAAPSAEPAESGRLARWLGSGRSKAPADSPAKQTLLLPEASATQKLAVVEATLAKSRDAAAQVDPPPNLIVLAHRLGLTDFERDTLLLAAAVEFDPGLPSLLSRVHGNPARDYPTFGIALNLFDGASWDALSAHRPLRESRLLDIIQPGSTPLTSSALRADERIVSFLKGLNIVDDRLTSLVAPVDAGATPVSDSQRAVVDAILNRLHDSVQESVLPIIQLTGIDSGSKIAVAAAASASLRRQLFRVNAESLPQQIAEVETLARLWERETLLLPVSLYIDATNFEGTGDVQSMLARLLSRGLGLVFIGVRDAPLKLNLPTFPIEVQKPTPLEQLAAWEAALIQDRVDDAEEAAAQLAGQFNFNLSEITEAASLAKKSSDEHLSVRDGAWIACRDLSTPRLDMLAQKLDVKSDWNDLVLPSEQALLLHGIAGQVRQRHTVYDSWKFGSKMNRGFGISALFAGESGTGKTMAAEVIANDLKLSLYRIDLSAVVSKYIGETEKNLRRLFDAAEQGGAILFFDEADALFGKRTEVKDSHDRYANIEINYLLQRMEAFSGLAILATNRKTALDPAFMRRLRFVVNFQFPSPKERQAIWEKSLPMEAPRSDLKFDRLARLSLSGGNIHSIALNAAFLAAQDRKNPEITMPLLMNAARMEMRKLDKPFTESEFRL